MNTYITICTCQERPQVHAVRPSQLPPTNRLTQKDQPFHPPTVLHNKSPSHLSATQRAKRTDIAQHTQHSRLINITLPSLSHTLSPTPPRSHKKGPPHAFHRERALQTYLTHHEPNTPGSHNKSPPQDPQTQSHIAHTCLLRVESSSAPPPREMKDAAIAPAAWCRAGECTFSPSSSVRCGGQPIIAHDEGFYAGCILRRLHEAGPRGAWCRAGECTCPHPFCQLSAP